MGRAQRANAALSHVSAVRGRPTASDSPAPTPGTRSACGRNCWLTTRSWSPGVRSRAMRHRQAPSGHTANLNCGGSCHHSLMRPTEDGPPTRVALALGPVLARERVEPRRGTRRRSRRRPATHRRPCQAGPLIRSPESDSSHWSRDCRATLSMTDLRKRSAGAFVRGTD